MIVCPGEKGAAVQSSAAFLFRLIGNLSNKANYDYADDDIIKIFEALQSELQEAQGRFSATEGGKEDNFSLT